MNNKFFKQIYDISTKVLQEEYNEKESIIENSNNINFSEYILMQDSIEKNNIKFCPYLINYEKIGLLEVDEDYNFKLNNSNLVYQSGLIVVYNEDEKEWTVSNLFLNETSEKEKGIEEYNKLLNMINDNVIEDLCNLIIKNIEENIKND